MDVQSAITLCVLDSCVDRAWSAQESDIFCLVANLEMKNSIDAGWEFKFIWVIDKLWLWSPSCLSSLKCFWGSFCMWWTCSNLSSISPVSKIGSYGKNQKIWQHYAGTRVCYFKDKLIINLYWAVVAMSNCLGSWAPIVILFLVFKLIFFSWLERNVTFVILHKGTLLKLFLYYCITKAFVFQRFNLASTKIGNAA